MKKIFTLISVALVAISANAQTESYLAIDDDGNISTEFANATQDDNGNMIVTIKGEHVTMTGVSSATPKDIKSDDDNLSYTLETWPEWNQAEWKQFNKNQNVWHWEGEEKVTDFYFRAIWGSGNPTTGFDMERVVDNSGNFAWTYRANYSNYYFVPGVSTATPVRGEYFEFTSDVDGLMKIGFGIANGTNRNVYVVEKETVKTLTAADFKVEGYVQGCDNQDGTPMWIPSIKINEDLTIGDTEFNQSYKDDNLIVVDQLQKVKFAWIVLDAKAGVTYMLFTPTSQIAFRDYQFTPGKTVDEYQPSEDGPDAPGATTAIKAIKNIAAANDAPVYNLAGQRVNAATKGLLIKNGKKFINK